MLRRVGKRGDTLIEVTLAIGIFSMIAIAITAVMSSGTSGAQTSLETTLAREEIDTQAEALRFIQTAYATNKNDTENNKFRDLWQEIKEHAIKMDSGGTWTEAKRNAVLQYTPSSCETKDLFPNDDIGNAAFIINPRTLGTFEKGNGVKGIPSVYIRRAASTTNTARFTQPSIYPRLVFASSATGAAADDAIIEEGDNNYLYRAEGLYVIAVRDTGTTTVVGDGDTDRTKQAFYDFYIRACWYGTDANEPSTIATVIRLYDPDAVEAATSVKKTYMQDWSGCSSLASGRTTTLYDRRDNQAYLVGKLADGKCWMLDNLRLGGSSTIALNSSNTNITGSYTLPASTTTGFNTLTTAKLNAANKNNTSSRKYGSGSGKVGVLYNYCAASAGQICNSSNTSNASQDICPAGWRLPTGTSSGEYQNLYNKYGNSVGFRNALAIASAGVAINDSVNWPDQLVLWTSSNNPAYSSAQSSMGAVYDQITDYLYPSFARGRSDGGSIRCVKK